METEIKYSRIKENANANQAIGIFDSGVGGLTVTGAIRELLPNESLVYFGDTAHLPYGEKSVEAIVRYSTAITQFLLAKRVKFVVIACNSASASAYSHLLSAFGERVLILDVINPVVDYIAKQHYSKVGIIGTKRTIESRSYEDKLNSLLPDLQIISKATPLLVPVIEEGFINHTICDTILNEYLSDYRFNDIEALILGCTHYPIIRDSIDSCFGHKVEIINQATIVAQKLKLILEETHLTNLSAENVSYDFYVSDYTPTFEKIARIFFNDDIHLKKAEL